MEEHGDYAGMKKERKDQIISLLKRGGARASLDIF